METSLPTPTTARVYVNLPEGNWCSFVCFCLPFFSDGFVWWIYGCRNTIVLNWSWINSMNYIGVYLVYSNPVNLEETLNTRNLWRKHHINYIQSWKLCLASFLGIAARESMVLIVIWQWFFINGSTLYSKNGRFSSYGTDIIYHWCIFMGELTMVYQWIGFRDV